MYKKKERECERMDEKNSRIEPHTHTLIGEILIAIRSIHFLREEVYRVQKNLNKIPREGKNTQENTIIRKFHLGI